MIAVYGLFRPSEAKYAILEHFVIRSVVLAAFLSVTATQGLASEGLFGQNWTAISITSSMIAMTKDLAAKAGFSATEHFPTKLSILQKIGPGGTGYVPDTLGKLGTEALRFVSQKVVIGSAIGVGVVSAGAVAYCYVTD